MNIFTFFFLKNKIRDEVLKTRRDLFQKLSDLFHTLIMNSMRLIARIFYL